MSTHDSLMTELAKQHEILLPLIGDRNVHYLDIPMHGNIGDLLILSGTLAFFKKHNVKVTHHGMYFNYRADWSNKDDLIILHGGGNFGDIYGPFQSFRERIVASCPDNRIIILPQSIHFESETKFSECLAIFKNHSDLHICVRDSVSAGLAKKMTSYVYLLPDMAHQLWPISRPTKGKNETLKLRRRDNESDSAIDRSGYAFDWDDLIGKRWTFFLSQIAERFMFHATRFGFNKPFSNLETLLWIWQAEKFIKKAIHLFSEHDKVESDRLHAHILASLLSIPNRIGDNAYGKNSRYIRQWTIQSDIVQLESNSNLFK